MYNHLPHHGQQSGSAPPAATGTSNRRIPYLILSSKDAIIDVNSALG